MTNLHEFTLIAWQRNCQHGEWPAGRDRTAMVLTAGSEYMVALRSADR